MRSVVDRNVVMRRIPVLGQFLKTGNAKFLPQPFLQLFCHPECSFGKNRIRLQMGRSLLISCTICVPPSAKIKGVT
jgi:hypothetical protein